jgi:hypothetical protein
VAIEKIEKDADMINRVKLDVFYIENWFLDLKLFIKLWLISIKEKNLLDRVSISINHNPTYNSSQFIAGRFFCASTIYGVWEILW